MTLTEFLLACIAEDEAAAREAALSAGGHGSGDERVASGSVWMQRYHEVARIADDHQDRKTIADAGALFGIGVATHIARHDPARVLAECEAKRAIVELHADAGGCTTCTDGDYLGLVDDWPCETLRLLTRPYVDHPDYREEWS